MFIDAATKNIRNPVEAQPREVLNLCRCSLEMILNQRFSEPRQVGTMPLQHHFKTACLLKYMYISCLHIQNQQKIRHTKYDGEQIKQPNYKDKEKYNSSILGIPCLHFQLQHILFPTSKIENKRYSSLQSLPKHHAKMAEFEGKTKT